MKKLLPLILFLTFSCGKLVDQAQNDVRFDSIKNQFEKDAALFGIRVETDDISIAFGDTRKKIKYAGVIPLTDDPGPAYGYCLVLGKTNNDIGKPLSKLALGNRHRSKRIVISDELKDFSVKDLEATVYHELGHCALGLGHAESEQLMSTSFNGNMDNKRYFMLQEMFTHKKDVPDKLIRTIDQKADFELVYETDYEVFGEHIFYQLFFQPTTGLYYFKNRR